MVSSIKQIRLIFIAFEVNVYVVIQFIGVIVHRRGHQK